MSPTFKISAVCSLPMSSEYNCIKNVAVECNMGEHEPEHATAWNTACAKPCHQLFLHFLFKSSLFNLHVCS